MKPNIPDVDDELETYINSSRSILRNNEISSNTELFRNFFEKWRQLYGQYQALILINQELSTFEAKNNSKSQMKGYNDKCDELQNKFVDSTEKYHDQIYKTIGLLQKVFNSFVPEKLRRGTKSSSTESLIQFIYEHCDNTGTLLALDKLKDSVQFRTFTNHPQIYKAYMWITFANIDKKESVAIYFEVDNKGVRVGKKEWLELSCRFPIIKPLAEIGLSLPYRVKNVGKIMVTPSFSDTMESLKQVSKYIFRRWIHTYEK